MGARVLGSLKNKLLPAGADIALYMVVNTCRPYTADKSQILTTAAGLSAAAGLELTGLVHNSNLMDDQSAVILEKSWPEVSAAARELGIPVAFAAGRDDILPQAWRGKTSYGVPLLRLNSYIRYADQI